MRTLLLLILCLALSFFQIESFMAKKRNLFIDRVSSQNFNYQYDYLHFSKDGKQMKMQDNTTASLQILTLESVYTSSKAVYITQTGKYIGVALLDSSVYMTKAVNSLINMNFDTLYFFGVQEKLLL